VKDLHTTYPGGDVGVLSVFFLNFLRLSPGEAIFIPANTPHAYLSGEILECMQNSDNVIRGGLTPKFKDVEVLIDSLSYDPFSGERVAPEIALSHGWQVWRPVDLFGVTKVDTEGTWKSSATSLGIILGGSARIGGVQREFGWAGVFLPDAAVEICQCSSNFVIFIADSL
jgi:mannose-6-phosphate isomerase